LLAAAFASAALAQTAEPAPPPADPGAAEQPRHETPSDFNASLTVYLWATSLSGDARVRGADLSVDAQFLDVVQDADTLLGLMGALDLQYKQLVFQIHPTWMHVGIDQKTAGAQGVPIRADYDSDTLWVEGFAGWRAIERAIGEPDSSRRFILDAFVGGRVTYLETDLGLTALSAVTLPDGTNLPAGTKVGVSDSEAWFDPFVGARVRIDLTKTCTLGLRGDIGGFGIGSEFAWQAAAFLSWKFDLFGADAALLLGYRALGQDYQDGNFAWDVIAHGPALGLNIAF
ncbi:MAG: hypothetical protein IBJ10_04610, partial [Phycisphaerales bacterium]|nr:hypothetical protein [Phycisphaerales bacterium]